MKKWIFTGSISGRDTFHGSASRSEVIKRLKSMLETELKYRLPQSITAELTAESGKIIETISINEFREISFNKKES